MWWLALLALAVGCGRIGFDAERTAPPVPSACLPDATELVACYAFDGDVTDSTTNRLDADALGIAYEPGRVGQAITIGATSEVYVADDPRLDLGGPVSIDAWVRVGVLSGRAVVVDRNHGLALRILANRQLQFVGSVAGAGQMLAGGALPTDVWTHVALTYDRQQLRLWIDALEVGSIPLTDPLNASSTDGWRIGGNYQDSDSSADEPLYGALDQLRIWSVALTASDLCAAATTCP